MIGTDDKEWNKIVELLPGKNIYITQEYNKLFEKHFCDEALLFVFGNESDFVVHPVWRSLARNFLLHFMIIASKIK
jgi:hypothetical protein